MGIVSSLPEPAKLADWLDKQLLDFEKQAIDWLEAGFIRKQIAPTLRVLYPTMAMALDASRMAAPGFIDVLRLGSDGDYSTGGAVAKTVVVNTMRVLTVAQPVVGGARAVASRTAIRGMMAVDSLPAIQAYEGFKSTGPCAYQAINNILSYFKGQPKQVYVDVLDIVAESGKMGGGKIGPLLDSAKVKAAFGEAGIIVKTLRGMQNTDDVIAHVRRTGEPVTFGLEWSNAAGRQRHAMTALRAPNGSVRLYDYADEVFSASPNAMGFGSIDEMFQARKHIKAWAGSDLATLVTSAANAPRAFTSRFLQILWTAENVPVLAYPVVVGLRWIGEHSLAGALKDIVASFAKHLAAALGDKAPAPPPGVDTALPPLPVIGSGPPKPRTDMLDNVYVGGSGVMLSKLSEKYYQTMHMWPLLWAANFELIGGNPNKVPTGIYLTVPKPSKFAPKMVSEARTISPQWNAYQKHVDWARSTNRALAALA